MPAAPVVVTANLDKVNNGAGGAVAAKGINAYENRGVNGYNVEPPDQAMCVGNGYVLESVNLVVKVYQTPSLAAFSGDQSLNGFFGLDPSTFMSDPKCLFDTDTHHWFVTSLALTDNSSSFTGFGELTQGYIFIAVSQTQLPYGAWNIYYLNVTDQNHPGCSFVGDPVFTATTYGCFGDQPLLGANRDALVLSTNEFNIDSASTTFNGAEVYFLAKRDLANGFIGSLINVQIFDIGLTVATPPADCGDPTTTGFPCWYSLQPATSPDISQYANYHNGAEYFLSALDFFGMNDNRIAVWEFNNTQTLLGGASTSPCEAGQCDVFGFVQILASELYTCVGNCGYGNFYAGQKVGLIPQGNELGKPEGVLNPNDDRMNQVVFSQKVGVGPQQTSLLWAGLDTVVEEHFTQAPPIGHTEDRTGIAYFTVQPTPAGPGLGVIKGQGYVAACDPLCKTGEDVLFPSIGVGPTGNGVMTFTLTGLGNGGVGGQAYFPSAAYSKVTQTGLIVGKMINVANMGMAPQDGFEEYPSVFGGVQRWGDYTAAVWSNGKVYFAAEYIQYASCSYAAFAVDTSCTGTRTHRANWGTSLDYV